MLITNSRSVFVTSWQNCEHRLVSTTGYQKLNMNETKQLNQKSQWAIKTVKKFMKPVQWAQNCSDNLPSYPPTVNTETLSVLGCMNNEDSFNTYSMIFLSAVWFLLHINFDSFRTLFRSANTSVHGSSNKLGDWVIEYAIFLHGLAQQWRPQKKQNLAQR